MVTPADRVLVAMVAVFNFFAAWKIAELDDARLVFLVAIWPWVFAAAGIACVSLLIWFKSPNVMAFAGGLTITAYSGRALVILVAFLDRDLDISDARAHLGVATWSFLAATMGWAFFQVLRPRAEVRRRAGPAPRRR